MKICEFCALHAFAHCGLPPTFGAWFGLPFPHTCALDVLCARAVVERLDDLHAQTDSTASTNAEPTYQRVDGIVAVIGDEIILASDIRDRVTQAKLEGRAVTDANECGLLESVLFEKLCCTTPGSTASR